MTLKEIALEIVKEYPSFSYKIKAKDTQIILQCEEWPDEVFLLLSPYYQNRIKADTFNAVDLNGLLIEADRIKRWGY